MLKKTIAAIAVAGSLFVLAPRAALADEVARPVSTTEESTTNAKRDAIAQQALADIEQRIAEDPVLAKGLYSAAQRGDTISATRLLASEGADVVAIGTVGGEQELARVTIRVTVTVCVTVWGTTYCGTVTVTVNLN